MSPIDGFETGLFMEIHLNTPFPYPGLFTETKTGLSVGVCSSGLVPSLRIAQPRWAAKDSSDARAGLRHRIHSAS